MIIEVRVRTFYTTDQGIDLSPSASFLLTEEAKPVDVVKAAKALKGTIDDLPKDWGAPREMTEDEVKEYREAEDEE